MIHTNRIVTVGEQECIIDRPIVLYRGDREVEIEFTLVGNEFMFSEEGNVIKSVNASHGQLVLNTPSGEHMFSELAECHEGKVVFVVTKEMIDEFIEMGFYSFQIRLYDSAEMKSRVTIPPVMNGFDIRNPIAAEDETNVVDQGIVDYARIFKDQSNEELPTFDWTGAYNKTEWVHHDVITENKMNKIEDALYSINANIKESDVVMLNTLDKIEKDADKYVKEHMAEVEQDVEEFERNLNTDVQQFKIDTNAAMTAHKNEVSEVVDGFDAQLARVENNFLTISIKDYENKTSNDTEMFNLAFENTNCEIIVPSGEYLIEDELVMSPSIKLVFQGGAKLKFVNNKAKLCVNYGCTLKDINIELPKLYNNSAIEISSRTITKLYQNKADVFVDGCYVSIPPSYDGMYNYEGCVFEMYALEEHEHNGFWNIHIQNVTFEGLMKYFCKNYIDARSWITSCSFKNITVNSCLYGWFGSKDENTVLTGEYKDIGALVIENIHYQCNNTKHICYFTDGQKRLKNMINWDWTVNTPQYCLSQDLAFNKNNRIIIDSFLTDITYEFRVEGVPDEVSSKLVRRIVATGGNEYLGNRRAQHETECSSHYRGFGLTANETVPLWFNAKIFVEGNSATTKGILSIFSDIRHDIYLYALNAGGSWYYMYNCHTPLIEDMELYGTITKNDYGQVLDLYIKFNKNLGAISFYKTVAKTDWYDEVILSRVRTEPDLNAFSKFVSFTKGCYLNELPSTYIPYLSTSGAKNHIAQKNNRVIYKTKNDIQETIPKFRMGTITTNGGAVNVTFNELGITSYNVFVDAPIEFSISNKTSTGFTLTSTSSSKKVSWLVIG